MGARAGRQLRRELAGSAFEALRAGEGVQPLSAGPRDETELLEALGDSASAQLRKSVRTREVRRGEYIYFEAQPAEHLWVVRSGEVRTLRTSASGRITTLELVRPGGLFGMAAVVEDSHYTDSAQAVAAGEVSSVRQKTIAAVLQRNPEAGHALLRIVARRLQNAHDRLCSFANDSVTARLAQTVLDEAEGDRIELTRRILGESAGTTVETTIRILKGFEREGWIEGGVGWIRILDSAALEATAQDDKTGNKGG